MKKVNRSDHLMCAVYTVLWSLYDLQNYFNISVLAKYILVFVILFSIYKVLYVINRYKLEKFMRGVNLLLLMFTVYGVWYYLFGKVYYIDVGLFVYDVPKYYYLKYIYCSLLPIYVYYDYAKKGVFTQKTLFYYVLCFIGVSILAFMSNMMTTMAVQLKEEYSMTNNMGYRFIPILALLFLIKRWRTVLMLVCFAFIVLGLKRGAIIVGTITVLFHLWYMLRQPSLIKKICAIFFVAGLICMMSIFVIKFYENNPYFQSRMEATLDGDSSGRDRIYTQLYDYYVRETNPFVFLFGNGADATVGIIGNYAHNDWLELAINQGLLGIIVYILFYVFWFKNWCDLRILKDTGISMAFLVLLISCFLSSLFSMAYTGFSPINAICIGYVLTTYYQAVSSQKII